MKVRPAPSLFIYYAGLPELDGSYSVFGQLIGGWDTFSNLTPRDPATAQSPGDKIIGVKIAEE